MGKKVLIADDKIKTASVLSRGLSAAGYEVIVTDNGEEAVELAKKELPDLIILDIIMPGMDGFSANAILKSDKSTRDIPVIISSSQIKMKKMFQDSMGTKIDGFLEKPYTLEELWAKVEEVLGE